jgi:ATP-binding protein involved in chromosome partitioning
VLRALRSVRYPGYSRDIVSFGLVREIVVHGSRVVVRLDLGSPSPDVAGRIESEVRAALGSIAGVDSVDLTVAASPAAPAPAENDMVLPATVRHTVAVASGKGGVGKSTVAVNLAVALARAGSRTGLLDADVYGPSIPLMMGVNERPRLDESGDRIVPFERYGVRFMSLGFFVEPDSAVIWRGPMVMKALEQLLRDVAWGELDVLVVDLPPGTGDAQLTLSQKVRLSGSVIVTTPQRVALADAIKGVAMFRKVGVPVFGIVENMSYFACPHCHTRTEIFGHGGARHQAERLGVPFLGEIPIDPVVCQGGDAGSPIVALQTDSESATAFLAVASHVLHALR